MMTVPGTKLISEAVMEAIEDAKETRFLDTATMTAVKNAALALVNEVDQATTAGIAEGLDLDPEIAMVALQLLYDDGLIGIGRVGQGTRARFAVIDHKWWWKSKRWSRP